MTRTVSAVPWATGAYDRAVVAGRGPLYLCRPDGRRLLMDVERWCAAPDAADRTVLRRCSGSVLDIGCGPGRMIAALARAARPALGIDTAPAAVARSRAAGGTALLRSVFGAVPGEGWWGSALLLDGNVGIGGDPAALLRRVARLLAPGGLLIAEAAPEDVDERFPARLAVDDGPPGPAFPWARVGSAALGSRAEAEGWTRAGSWTVAGRPFLALVNRS
ncbi:methyltransferase domain-containing protein [Streptomyces sp. 8K308]|uniref:methyltransferase domain-containing protein n=1 Tax=Streptomyces sp. 8K308 TaxID=2530388 RepID=UPI0010F237A3|nr:methyltransferase domain-containing protein [Streptomyces sp. 8K308]TDC21224.1 methyltransferase domain-containing protein [Streptomyces sp. 8K308]